MNNVKDNYVGTTRQQYKIYKIGSILGVYLLRILSINDELADNAAAGQVPDRVIVIQGKGRP